MLIIKYTIGSIIQKNIRKYVKNEIQDRINYFKICNKIREEYVIDLYSHILRMYMKTRNNASAMYRKVKTRECS